MLLAASALVFVIACSNVANLILARSVRREGELAIRAALGASAGALRRTLLAESLLLCGAGAILGVLIARPMVAVLARYASRFSVRALDLTVDATLLWVGVGLAIVAAVLLAFVPRLPSSDATSGFGSRRTAASASRRAPIAGCASFAVTQIAASFVLLAGAGMLLTALLALQTAPTGLQDEQRPRAERAGRLVRAAAGRRSTAFYREALRRIARAAGRRARGRRHDRAVARRRQLRPGIPVLGRGLREGERRGRSARAIPHRVARVLRRARRADHRRPRLHARPIAATPRPVVIVSQSVAQRMFPTQDALNRRLMWTDPVMKFIDVSPAPRRIVGIAADVDDENVVPGPALSVYHPFEQEIGGGRMFVHARTDPVRAACRRSRASSANCPPSSRWSGRRRWTTSGRRCWRRIG